MTDDWLAGFIDGEGSIMLGKKFCHGKWFYLLRVDIQNCHFETLQTIKINYGGKLHAAFRNNPRAKDAWCLSWGMREAVPLLARLSGKLITKKEQARVALEFAELWYNTKPPKKKRGVNQALPDYSPFEALRLQMGLLNHRGRYAPDEP